MKLIDYAGIVQSIDSFKEDARLYRKLNLEPIHRHSQTIADYVKNQGNIIEALLAAKEFDQYESTHPVDVAIIAAFIGKWLRLTVEETYELACAGLLHDVGKARIRDSLLNQTRKLSEEDRDLLHTHAQKGFECVENEDELSESIKDAVLYHHERRDGSGYPEGLIGDEIPLFAKIIAVADIFDAMISNRTFTTKKSIHIALREIAQGSFDNLDPNISQLFYKKTREYYRGLNVMLSNGDVGEVIYVYPNHPYDSIIQCQNAQYDLSKQRDLEIIDFFVKSN